MGLSIRAYAQHRGVSHTAVAKAIKAGRISKEPDGTIDPAKADAQWARNTLPSQNLNTGAPKTAPKVATPPVSTSVSTAPVANRELQPPLETGVETAGVATFCVSLLAPVSRLCDGSVLRSHCVSALAGSMVPSGSLLMRPALIALATAVWLTPRCWA